MKQFLNTYLNNKISLVVFTLLVFYQFSIGQNVTGASPVTPNSTHTYIFNDGFLHFPSWTVTGGTLVSSGWTPGTTYEYYATVQWGAAGSGTVTLKQMTIILGSKNVTISSPPSGPEVPTMPTITNHAGYTVLTKVGTPPSGEEWYWQGSSTGTFISPLNAQNSMSLTSGTVYFLRSYKSSTSQWSPARVVNYTVGDPTSNVSLSDENYIYTITPKIGVTDVSTLGNDEKIENVNYYDGLGRAMQSIVVRAGGQNQDVITHIEYDNLGRQNKNYLPYAIFNTPGMKRTSVLTETTSFYNTSKYENTTNPFSEKSIEASPLNRVLKQSSPGEDWKLGNGHEIEFDYHVNTSTDVKKYVVAHTSTANNTYTPSLSLNGNYGSGDLYKTITKNENHDGTSTKANTTEEFKDKEGRVVLTRTYGTSKVNGVSQTNVAHDTYYVYDSYGNLTYVLPPKAEPHAALPDATELSELCYQYIYDDRNRLVEKKTPGKGWEYIVYNELDLPILTQHANQIAANNPNLTTNQWSFIKYDRFGRSAYTGLISSNNSRITLQNTVNGTSQHYVTKSTTSNSIAGTTIYYNNGAYPTSISEIHTINYYDDYTFDKDGLTIPISYDGQSIINYNNINKALTKSLATGSKVRVLNTSPVKWITTITGYDVKGRPIYVASKNQFLNSTNIVKNKLDFTGMVGKTETSHDRNTTSIYTEDLFTYDHMGRLLKQTQELNNTNIIEVIVENTYDTLGQLVVKGVGGKTAHSRLQNIDYTYNIRGWLKGINDVANIGTKDLFALKIGYNESVNPLYNGNISSVNTIASPHINHTYTYDYTYDALNRLKTAISYTKTYANYNVGSLANPITYDKNGNITSLFRNGAIKTGSLNYKKSSHWGEVDNLIYNYSDGNKLLSVTDNGSSITGFKDGNTSGNDYTYDANGNMLTDLNKGISSNISYNNLNLPTYVPINGGNISYIYDATGVKLKKVVSTGTTTEYAGNYVYEDGSLKFFNHSEGYVDAENGYTYIYQYKDHLGNLRMSYGDLDENGSIDVSTEILEKNNYYPFGLKHGETYNNIVNGSNIALDWKYNGIEYEEALGLNLYEMDVRSYDPTIARFTGIDPVTHHSMSTYTAFDNNPVFWADPSGADAGMGDFGVTEGKMSAINNSMSLSSGFNDLMGNRPIGNIDNLEDLLLDDVDKLNADVSMIYLPEVEIVQGDKMSYRMAAWKTESAIKGTSYYDSYRPQLRTYENTTADNWAEGNLLQRAAYETVNSFSIVSQSLNPFDNQVTDLRGSYVGHKDNSGHGAIVMATLLPMPKGMQATGKINVPVYRTFGGASRAQGFSWSLINPRIYGSAYRNFAGLPSTNTANFMIRGKVQLKNIIDFRPAKPLDGNFGRLVPEIIANPNNVQLNSFRVLKN